VVRWAKQRVVFSTWNQGLRKRRSFLWWMRHYAFTYQLYFVLFPLSSCCVCNDQRLEVLDCDGFMEAYVLNYIYYQIWLRLHQSLLSSVGLERLTVIVNCHQKVLCSTQREEIFFLHLFSTPHNTIRHCSRFSLFSHNISIPEGTNPL
jgi:hypothetical protein